MVVRIVLWSLADSKTTIEELRRYLRDEAVDEFAEVDGLRFKAWISDPLGERWGAFYLFESREAADQVLPTGVRDLIGKDPEVVEEFDLEASIEGRFARERALAARPCVRVAERYLTTKVLLPSSFPYCGFARVPRAPQTYQSYLPGPSRCSLPAYRQVLPMRNVGFSGQKVSTFTLFR